MTEFISTEEWLRLQKPSISQPKKEARKKNKFKAKQTERDGRNFPSELEADTYDFLKLLEQAGELKDIERQQTAFLTEAEISWRLDFRIYDLRLKERVWVEAKGLWTPDALIKKKLWKVYGPGRLRIFKRARKKDGGLFKVVLAEPEIIPRYY